MTKKRIWLILLILIGWGLRLAQLGEQSLWYDEGVTWMLSQMQLSALIEWTAADIQPPLYYLLIWTTDIFFGDSEWMLRFPSAIFNLLTIPLIYALAQRLFTPAPPLVPEWVLPRTPAPLLAALLFTLSPLMIYYSQEARMYTLLTFEATLAGYLLVNSITNYQLPISNYQSPIINYQLSIITPLLYALTAAAALYTHYFAAFLLIAHAVYALFILWQRRFAKNLAIQLLIAFGGALLLFAPWLPILLARLGDDPSYWPGALKLNEVIRKILIAFTAGETVFEQTGWQLALIYFGFLILDFGLILSPVTRHSSFVTRHLSFAIRYSLIFLLLWLFVPLLLILSLTYQSPKFNPRYTLLAWPAFALLTAAALTGLYRVSGVRYQVSSIKCQVSGVTHQVSRVTYHASRITFYAFPLFILATATFSLFNWYTDPRFSKDDFKALAQFVRERKATDETVLLSSGHLFPVWAYYYGWDGWTPLPWMLRLDVNRVTNLDMAGDIAAAVAGHNGVWLVTWQDEVIDPNGVVPFWLDMIGARPDDAGDFWGVGLEHWRLDADKIGLLQENPIQRTVAFITSHNPNHAIPLTSYNFANQVELLGFTQLDDASLALFWRPLRPLPNDLTLTLKLTDSDDFNWGRETFVGPPGSTQYPPSRWPVGQIAMTRHSLPWQIGAPPGLYTLEVGLGQAAEAAPNYIGWDILDEQGRPLRRTALLDFVNVSQLVRPAGGPLPLDNNPEVDLFPLISARRIILPQDTAQPGDRLLLALLWQAGEYNLDNISIAFDLIDAQGQTFRVGSSFTPSREFNLPRWQPGDIVLGQYWLDIPPTAAPGPAELKLHIINVTAFPYDEVFPLAQLTILPTERNFALPDSIDTPLKADFSGQAVLLGLDCPNNCRAAPGESVTLTLYWQAAAPLETNYTIFTHLLDAQENMLINADHAPPKPTQGWVSGEIIADPVTLTIPANLPSGDYALEIGLYDAADPAFERLPLATGDNRVLLPQSLTVE